MADWRERILEGFTPRVARVTLAADPDGLLLEEVLLEAIRERGFGILVFENPVAFRFACESRFRSCWDRGETADLVVVLPSAGQDFAALPYDLLQTGRQLSFSLGRLFPNLSYPVVTALDRSDLDPLYRAQMQHQPGRLGDDASMDFVLRHVFHIEPALIKHAPALLCVLLRKHFRGQFVPRILNQRLVQVLRRGGAFSSWPLESIVLEREAFFAFLQERWPLFLNRLARHVNANLREGTKSYRLKIQGPDELPFDHDDVRIYIDNMFVERMLQPVFHPSSSYFLDEWVSVGILVDPEADKQRRLRGLLEGAAGAVPEPDSRHQDWTTFAYRWSELGVLWSETATAMRSCMKGQMAALRTRVNQNFLNWMGRRFAGLHNQPPAPPAMVHHLPRYLARWVSDNPRGKVTLIVADGLSLDQWIVLRRVLATQRPRLRFRESAVFAWVPTITSVSRQAIFAGKTPFYFPASIRTTDRESYAWNRFWTDQGLASREVRYAKGLGDGPLDEVRDLLSGSRIRALGLVVDKVDRIMHGMELGTAGMHNQVRQWAGEGFLAELLDVLLDGEFAVFLTSDHGNIEAEGIGRPSEGAIADVRGERARVYPDAVLRARVKERFPNAIEWPAVGLPEDYLALLAPDRSAFVREGERIVGHGGVSLEEVVVPMVQIERSSA